MDIFQRRLRTLYDHTVSLSQANSVEEVLGITFLALGEALEGNSYDIAVLEDGILRDAYQSAETGFSLSIDAKSITTRAAREKKPQLVNDTRIDPDYILGKAEKQMLSELTVPIIVNNETYGIINVESLRLNAYNEDDKDVMVTFAVNIANAIERLRRVEILKETVNLRTKELEESNQALQELDEMKTQFLSIAAHEFRTPLSSIIGYLELIESLAEQVPQEALLYLEIIKRNTDRLETIVSDLLVQQRLMRGIVCLELEEMDPSIFLRAVIQENEPIVFGKRQIIQLEIEVDIPKIILDEIRISQVLTNLIHNASKFSEEGSIIDVSLKRNGDYVIFSVRDHGIGISKRHISQLFKPFPDIPGRNRYGGTGLGLSICKGFIDLHGGEIWAESEGEGFGTTVSFSLPITRTVDP